MILHILINRVLCFWLVILATSCSNYVSKLHRQMDRDSSKNNNYQSDRFTQYKLNSNMNSDNQNAKALSTRATTHNPPTVRREYQQKAIKRVNVSDFEDQGSEGSLWYGRGQENFLFSKNEYKNIGDIIVIKVMEKLKQEISLELSKVFQKKKKHKEMKKGNITKTEDEKKQNENSNETTNASSESSEKIYDQISSIVIEEINKDHILVKGRKDVLYRNQKRLVEIQALIARRNINEDDTVLSKNVIETNVIVLR